LESTAKSSDTQIFYSIFSFLCADNAVVTLIRDLY